MALIAAGVTFIVVTLIILAILLLPIGPRSTRARLRRLTQPSAPSAPQLVSKMPREDAMPTVTKLLSGYRLTQNLYVQLSSAGLPIRPSEFIGIVAGSLILSQFLAILIVRSLLGYVLFAVIAVAIPLIVLKSLQYKRRMAFDTQLVDALLMMASSLRSGFSFLRAMQMVSQEMSPPISLEFARVISEVNVGRPLEDALRNVVTRVKSYDFDLAVTAVLIQHQVGGNLADILETIAGTIRERVKIIGEIRALTAEGKISGVILVLLPIFLAAFLISVHPTYISELINEPIGRYLAVTAIALQIIGTLIIKKMLLLDI